MTIQIPSYARPQREKVRGPFSTPSQDKFLPTGPPGSGPWRAPFSGCHVAESLSYYQLGILLSDQKMSMVPGQEERPEA